HAERDLHEDRHLDECDDGPHAPDAQRGEPVGAEAPQAGEAVPDHHDPGPGRVQVEGHAAPAVAPSSRIQGRNGSSGPRVRPTSMNHSVPKARAKLSSSIDRNHESGPIWLSCARIEARFTSSRSATSTAWVIIASGLPKICSSS